MQPQCKLTVCYLSCLTSLRKCCLVNRVRYPCLTTVHTAVGLASDHFTHCRWPGKRSFYTLPLAWRAIILHTAIGLASDHFTHCCWPGEWLFYTLPLHCCWLGQRSFYTLSLWAMFLPSEWSLYQRHWAMPTTIIHSSTIILSQDYVIIILQC